MNKKILYILGFLIKGWEVSLLLVLPILQTLGKINIFELGMIASVFSLFQIGLSFFSGHLAAKFGTKQVMVMAFLLYSLAWFTLSILPYFFPLMLIYALGGMATGIFIPLVNSQIAKMFEKNRAQELGDFSAFSDVGRVVLSALVTFLITNISFLVAALSYAFMAIISTGILQQTRVLNVDSEKHLDKTPISIAQLLKIKKFILVVSTGIGDVFSSASLFIFIPLLLLPKGIPVSFLGFFSALFFVGYLFGRVLLGRLAGQYGSIKILLIAQVSMAILIILLVFTSNLVLVAAVLFLLGVFTRGTSPVIRAMVAETIHDKHKFDKAFSFHSFCLNISNILSRSVYGFSAGIFGITSVFYISAMIALLTLIPLFFLKKNFKV